jgi:hypothetical protein
MFAWLIQALVPAEYVPDVMQFVREAMPTSCNTSAPRWSAANGRARPRRSRKVKRIAVIC